MNELAASRPRPATASARSTERWGVWRGSLRVVPVGLLAAVALLNVDLTRTLGPVLMPGTPHPVVHGWREIDRHRALLPLPSDTQRVLMIGACQVAGLNCHYGDGGRQDDGLCSTPHLLEESLRHDGWRVEVDNLGMLGIGYLPMLYLVLATLDAPNAHIVVQSLAQGGIYYFNGIDWLDAQTCQMGDQLRRRLARLAERHPDIPEIAELRGMLVELRPCLAGDSSPRLDRWADNSAWLSRTVHRWIDHLSRFPWNHSDRAVEEIMASFVEKKDPYGRFAEENVRLRPMDVVMFRMLAKVLAAEHKRYVLVNPPDLGTQLDPNVYRLFWEPLERALADLPGVHLIDLGHLPVTHGRDLHDHVALTYYGNLKVADALKPHLEEMLRDTTGPR